MFIYIYTFDVDEEKKNRNEVFMNYEIFTLNFTERIFKLNFDRIILEVEINFTVEI